MLECGGGWIAHWMDRLDEFLESYGWATGADCRLTPREYFQRQCWISFDPGERTGRRARADRAAPTASSGRRDFPHSDAKYPGVVDELRESTTGLEPDGRARRSSARTR